MVGLIQGLAEILKCIEYKIVNHVRRDGNKAADFLANWGCNEEGGKVNSIWPIHWEELRWEPFNLIITQDNNEITNLR